MTAPNAPLKFWSGFYSSCPKVYLPGTQFDVGFIFLSTIFFCSLRLSIEYFYANYHGFDPENIRFGDITSSSTSTLHSLILVPSLLFALRDQPYMPAGSITNAPQYYKDTVTALLSFCTGYMCYDFVFLLIKGGGTILPADIPFVGHHIVTSLYMSQCRVLGAGHISAMSLMCSGEFSNPLQNGHNITKMAIQLTAENTFWHAIHPYLEYIFAAVYFFFRAIFAPVQLSQISYHLLTKEGRKNIKIYIGIPWIIMIWGIILGSIPWTIETWEMLSDGLEVKYHKDYDYGPGYEL